MPVSHAGASTQPGKVASKWAPRIAEAQAKETVWKPNKGKKVGNWNLAACRDVTDQADIAVLSKIGCTTEEIEAIWTFYHRVYMAGVSRWGSRRKMDVSGSEGPPTSWRRSDAMSDTELQELYLATLVSLEEQGIMVLARKSVLVAAAVVHVKTAWNPGDERPTRAEYGVANERLRVEPIKRGLDPVRAVGADPDSDHFEDSWAVSGLSDDEARAIGAEFGQVAVFRLANGVQTVLACSAEWTRSRSL